MLLVEAKEDGLFVEGEKGVKGVDGSIVHKRTVHLLPSERIKGFRMLRRSTRPPWPSLSLSFSLFFSLSLVLYFPLSDCLRPSSTPSGGLST